METDKREIKEIWSEKRGGRFFSKCVSNCRQPWTFKFNYYLVLFQFPAGMPASGRHAGKVRMERRTSEQQTFVKERTKERHRKEEAEREKEEEEKRDPHLQPHS